MEEKQRRDKEKSHNSKRVQEFLVALNIIPSLTLHHSKLQYIPLFLIQSSETLFLVTKATCYNKNQCHEWGCMEADTHKRQRGLGIGNQVCERNLYNLV